MRIAILCPNASSNALVRTYPIAKVLARRHQLQVLGFRSGPEIFEPYRDEFEYETLLLRKQPAFLGQLRALARRVEADAVLAFKPLPSSLWLGLAARRRLGIPLFLDVEDWETGWYYDVPLRDRLVHLLHVERPNGLLWTWLSERLASRCDEIFVVSRFLERRFGGTVLPHGADTAFFDPSRWPAADMRQRLGLPPGRYVVFTGSPMPNKGLGDLLEAVDALDRPDLRVLLVGSFAHDPAYGERLMSRYPKSLLYVGPRPHREMPLYLAAADVVALPQQPCRETRAQVPGKVFEAMAMARPILATDVGDLAEILDDCGRVVAPGSQSALRQGLAELLDAGDESLRLGERARARCQSHYSWDAMERILDERLARWERR
jgi:glycosyltransferase involved in cell wall biosynthesis